MIGSVVYCVASSGFLKIGVTTDFAKRLSTLQIGNPVRIDVVALVAGDTELESEIQSQFCNLRVRGEWFKDDKRIRSLFLGHSRRVSWAQTPKPQSDAKKLTDALGRDAIASAVGVKSTAVITQASSGTFPAAWFDAVEKMAGEAGIECPRGVFRFKPNAADPTTEAQA